jgi:predicted nucleic acid-binding protein
MAKLLDTNLWIDLTRARSSQAQKRLVSPYVLDPQACLAEPIVFEVLRNATEVETLELTSHFKTLPLLASPPDLWGNGVELGRSCRRIGVTPNSIDLLIAVVAIHHGAELVTFDAGFKDIARASELKVKLLKRPGA